MTDRSSVFPVRWWSVVAAVAVLAMAEPARSAERVVVPAEARLRSDVTFLADDAREGRSPGTVGIESAADYIAAAFKEAGLTTAPGADGYFQPFSILDEPRIVKPPELSFQGTANQSIQAGKDDFAPLAIGSGGTLDKVGIVFAGYGITARDEAKSLNYDDYAGIDVAGKAVMILRREPRQDRADSPFDGKRDSRYAWFRHKATNAFQHGAAAVLLVNDLAGLRGGKDELMKFRMAGGAPNSSIPFVMLSRSLADRVLVGAGQPSLADLEKQIDEDLKPKSRALPGWTVGARIAIERTSVLTKNVVGVLEGSGPLASETLIVGAHYDHVGRGGASSGSLKPDAQEIHNGADDNASGTAMLLEMARRLARRADPLPRRVVFIAFSGEERGLLGSQHYVEHPLFPLAEGGRRSSHGGTNIDVQSLVRELVLRAFGMSIVLPNTRVNLEGRADPAPRPAADTVMMVNFDMVGRLSEKSELTFYGTGTSPGIDALVDALGKSQGFTVKKVADGMGPSDQQSFYERDIPVLFAFTGTHSDYHRPTDDVERINFVGMTRIADLSELLLLDLARRPRRPEFVRVVNNASHDPGRVSISAYLGSIPDYAEDVKGVKLNGVRSGSPAEKGGLKGGDVIVKFGGKAVGTIYDYTDSLSRQKPGDTVEVVVLRDGKETSLSVTLGKKPE